MFAACISIISVLFSDCHLDRRDQCPMINLMYRGFLLILPAMEIASPTHLSLPLEQLPLSQKMSFLHSWIDLRVGYTNNLVDSMHILVINILLGCSEKVLLVNFRNISSTQLKLVFKSIPYVSQLKCSKLGMISAQPSSISPSCQSSPTIIPVLPASTSFCLA